MAELFDWIIFMWDQGIFGKVFVVCLGAAVVLAISLLGDLVKWSFGRKPSQPRVEFEQGLVRNQGAVLCPLDSTEMARDENAEIMYQCPKCQTLLIGYDELMDLIQPSPPDGTSSASMRG